MCAAVVWADMGSGCGGRQHALFFLSHTQSSALYLQPSLSRCASTHTRCENKSIKQQNKHELEPHTHNRQPYKLITLRCNPDAIVLNRQVAEHQKEHS